MVAGINQSPITPAANKSLWDWFKSAGGTSLLEDKLKAQAHVPVEDLAREIAGEIKLEEIPAGRVLLQQETADGDRFLILGGQFAVTIGGHMVARLGPGQHVSELSAITGSRRSATVSATADGIVARVGKGEFAALAGRFPGLWQCIAVQLAKRAAQSKRLHLTGTPA
ncbi:MAG: cyclic nucleotide-binding domain-containing protein [Candidatus Binataceae bacterium]|jgi:CRP-like cAMP-binding protein